MSEKDLFTSVLDMARAAKRKDVSSWLQARCSAHCAEDSAYLTSMLLGILIENDAIRSGVHPADAWQRLRQDGLDNFG